MISICMLSLLLSGCHFEIRRPEMKATAAASDPAADLQAARAKWATFKIGDQDFYELELSFSGAFGVDQYITSVDANGVTDCYHRFRLYNDNTSTISPCLPGQAETVESLFQRIAEAIASGKFNSVAYNSMTGVPEQISILGDPVPPEIADVVSGYFANVRFSYATP